MTKVLIIMPWIRQGGAELIAVETAFFLSKIGYKVKLAALFVDTSDMGERAGQIDYVVPAGRVSRLCRKNKWFLYFLGPFFLFSLVLKQAREMDALFPHSLPAHWVASVVGKVSGKPVVWLCNEPPAKISLKDAKTVGWADFIMWLIADSFLDRFFARGVQKIAVHSDAAAREVAARYGKDSKVIRLGVDFEFFSKKVPKDIEALKKKYRLGNKFVLLIVGKLHPQKNQRLGIEVLAKVAGGIPQARLVLVGDGPDERKLKVKSEKLKVSDKVIFSGFCPLEKVRAWYHLCDLVLFPVLPQTSGTKQSWGFIPVEALCTKKLSIVSGGTGVAEVLEREKIGIIAPPNVEEFSRRVLEFYNNPSKFESLVKAGFAYVWDNLSWEKYAEKVAEVLEESMEGG